MTTSDQNENTPKQDGAASAKMEEAGAEQEVAKKQAGKAEKAVEGTEEKAKTARVGRIIIRNIQYDMRCSHLEKEFGKFGKVVDTNVPMKSDKPHLNRGFGFVEFETREQATKAIEKMHNHAWKGRTLAVELSVPKGSYEHKVEVVVKHTGLDKKDAVLPKILRDERKDVQAEKDRKAEEKRLYEEKNAAKIKKQEKKKAKKNAAKREEAKANLPDPLFVRNIGYDIDQAKFREFCEKFGPVVYAVLCKAHGVNENNDDFAPIEGSQPKPLHKGTGFVQFKTQESTDQLLSLSEKEESHLDEERKNTRLKKTTQDTVVSSLTMLQNEIELGGRRLIVKSSVSKYEAGVIKEKQKAEDRRKKEEQDKRNLGMAKEGLLNESNWINQEPIPTKAVMQLRERLYIAKDKALRASTNLFISKTRIQIRNLPRREFFEKELKELMRVVAEEWSKNLDKESYIK